MVQPKTNKHNEEDRLLAVLYHEQGKGVLWNAKKLPRTRPFVQKWIDTHQKTGNAKRKHGSGHQTKYAKPVESFITQNMKGKPKRWDEGLWTTTVEFLLKEKSCHLQPRY
jgi:transposase